MARSLPTEQRDQRRLVAVLCIEWLGTIMIKEQWTEQVFQLLCKSQGVTDDVTERKNLRGWAEAIADSDYYAEGMTPQEAHDEELSCA